MSRYMLPPKPKSSFRHLKQGIQEFHRKYVLVPADKAAKNVVVFCRLHCKLKIFTILFLFCVLVFKLFVCC